MTSQQLLERVVELAAKCRDDGMGGAEFVSTVAYGHGHVSQFRMSLRESPRTFRFRSASATTLIR